MALPEFLCAGECLTAPDFLARGKLSSSSSAPQKVNLFLLLIFSPYVLTFPKTRIADKVRTAITSNLGGTDY